MSSRYNIKWVAQPKAKIVMSVKLVLALSATTLNHTSIFCYEFDTFFFTISRICLNLKLPCQCCLDVAPTHLAFQIRYQNVDTHFEVFDQSVGVEKFSFFRKNPKVSLFVSKY